MEASQVSRKRISLLLILVSVLSLACAAPLRSRAQDASVGTFEGHADVGTVLHPGSTEYDAAKKTYTLTGSGENMWFSHDHFQFAWKKMSGDVNLTAEISFPTAGGNEHKKAALMIRQDLDTDSVYADIARHGNGMTALQVRDEKGGTTREIVSSIQGPTRLRITKRGDYVYMSLAAKGGDLQLAGGWLRVPIQGAFYVGIGVCSHDKDVVEKAVFANVDISTPAPPSGQTTLYSALSVVPIAGPDVHVVYLAQEHFEAPNWTRDGKAFIFNRDGHILRLPVEGGTPEIIDTGFATLCNNDHGISPDGTQLVISDQSQENHQSLVYMLPLSGGTPKRITKNSPSYWHGWSPDGKTLAFVGQRNDDFDIYSIPVTGGDETRLTTAKGLDDGPEYSPDGKYIYFNSVRTGLMQIWRMKPDGSEQEQVFNDDYNNWFPHISPDGKWMVFISFDKSVEGHPPNKDVTLRVMSLADKKISVLAKLFGGQGTINVPSWSPDSTRLAFVSYQLIPKEDFAAK
jgi:TolB protein